MTYTTEFYVEEGRVARESATIVIPWLLDQLGEVDDVIDIGCGTGEWGHQTELYGCTATGIDWNVLPELQRLTNYTNVDLCESIIDCDGTDLVICLEVMEHLPEERGPELIAGMSQAAAILFSAATPGQPGVDHVNCQPHDYWHDLFAQHGLHPTYIGGQFDEPVADFYRRNMYLYRRNSD